MRYPILIAISVVIWLYPLTVGNGDSPSGLTVRVAARKGVPQILVNGSPYCARIFWGAPASGLIALRRGPQVVQFDFTPSQSETTTATMHFRFGQVPGEVALDNIEVVDVDTGSSVIPISRFDGQREFARDWMVWPPAPENTVGNVSVEPGIGEDGSSGLRVRLRAPQTGAWPDFHIYHTPNLAVIKGHRYRVRFWINTERERDLAIAFYRPGTTFVHLGGPPGHFESQIKLAHSAGVDMVSFEVPLPWPQPGESTDWQSVDSICDRVLRANPRALLIPRIPVYVPEWWKRAHPDELMRWEDGRDKGIASPASPIYRRDSSQRLASLIDHIESRFGNQIAGYHPCGQNTGEWFYFDSWERPLSGYAPCDLIAWRDWLRSRYRSIDSLRSAWSDSSADFGSVTVPSPAVRHSAPGGIFRDPVAERPLIDFTEFQQESMAGCVRALARTVRMASHGRKLVVFFYGYVFEFGALRTGPGISGHYALRSLLNCPDIDVLCSPISYFDRGPAQSAPCMSAAESVALANKLWLNEDDTRTFLTRESNFPGAEHEVKTLDETTGELIRNVAQEATRNFGTWWMDLPGTGWFDDPGIWRAMERLKRLDDPLLRNPIPFRPDIAAIIDESSMCRVAEGGDAVTRPALYEARAALGRTGAPYGQYLLDDVLKGNVPAKLKVFLNAWALSPKSRAGLVDAMKNSACVWCYAPGYFDGFRKSPAVMRELSGFTLKEIAAVAWATPTAEGMRKGITRPFGVRQIIRPLFAVRDAKANEVLATYPDGSAAVAYRRTGKGFSLFVGPPGLTPELLRFAAKQAGVHLYTQDDTIVYANGPYIAVHGVRDGPVSINLRRTGPVVDVLEGNRLGAGRQITLRLRKGQTRVLKCG